MAHLKRLAAPRNWAIARRKTKWIAKPRPGPHPLERSIPLSVAVTEYLRLTDTAREARRVIGAGEVLVDGAKRKDPNFPVSYMDTVSVPKLGAHYRVLVDRRGIIKLNPTSQDRVAWKLARVEDKTTLRGGLTQLNLHDGRNLVVTKDKYRTGDTLKLAVPKQEVLEHFPLKPGHVALVIGGRHVGEVGTVEKVEVLRGPYENLVHLKGLDGGAAFSTVKRYVFVVGTREAEISIPKEGTVAAPRPVVAVTAGGATVTEAPAPKAERPPKPRREHAEPKREGEPGKEHAPRKEQGEARKEHKPKEAPKEGEHGKEHAPRKEQGEAKKEHMPKKEAAKKEGE